MKDAKHPSGLAGVRFPKVATLLLVALLLCPLPVSAADESSQNPFRWLGEFLGQGTKPSSPESDSNSKPDLGTDSVVAPTPPAFTNDETVEELRGGFIEDPFSVGTRLTLAITAPSIGPETSTADRPCISKKRNNILFCVEPVEWPADLSAILWVTSHMYQGNHSVVRFDGGQATYIHALIPSTAFNDAVAWYTDRLGTPDNDWERTINLLGGERQSNPTVAWRGSEANSQSPVIMEIRKYDDTRGGFPDARRGAILLYQPDAEPIFPQLSSVELMALRITDSAPPPRDTVIVDDTASEAAESSPDQLAISVAGNSSPELEQPVEQPTSFVSTPQMSGANPFDPSTRIGAFQKPSQAEGTAVADSTRTSASMAPGEVSVPGKTAQTETVADLGPKRRIGFFGRLANSFKAPTEPARQAAPLVTEPVIKQVNMLPALVDTTLTIGNGFTLGRPLLVDAESGGGSVCETHGSDANVICMIDVRWEPGIAAVFKADNSTKSARITYRNGQATSLLQRFPHGAFIRMKHYLENLYGPPTTTLSLAPADKAETGATIRSFLWRSKSSVNGTVTTLELSRAASDTLAQTDAPFGAMMLYGEDPLSDMMHSNQAGAGRHEPQ